jgi:hypothetical protein
MKHYFYLDEAGDHGLSFVDKKFPYFLLCGCLLSEENKKILDEKFNKLKQDFFKSKDIILHSRDIRRCEKEFGALFNPKIKEFFYNQLNKSIEETKFTIISAAIQKEKLIKTYGKYASNPYHISLAFIIERLVYCLEGIEQNSTVEICVESRGKKKEDCELLNQYNYIFNHGTYCVAANRIKNKIKKFEFRKKQQNDNGLQLADLCAYPLVKSLIYPEKRYIPFDIIKQKIYSKNNQMYGLKIFP